MGSGAFVDNPCQLCTLMSVKQLIKFEGVVQSHQNMCLHQVYSFDLHLTTH